MTSEESSQQSAGESAGSLLRQGREKKGLSVSDIADSQHLRPAVIQAIEDGDYQQIDSELFLKGYVRAYAKQVGLEADSVVAILDKELEPLRLRRAEALEANPLVDIERRRRQKRRFAKILIVLVALLVAAYLVFRFVDDGSVGTEATPNGEQESGDLQEPEGGLTVDNETEISTGELDQPALDADSGEPDEVPATDVVEGTYSLPESGGDDTGTETPVTAPDDAVTVSEPEEVAEPAVTDAADSALEESSPESEAIGTGRLQVTFSGDCWIRVTDAAGIRLVSSIQQEGDRIDVSGKMPLNVVIGAVNAVADISFQGEPVDLSDYPVVNNRAQFTLEI
ncbi:RodZ domain-containing protein [uncultured Marinobacter sp.]|uniref:RodZ domain-containing protein n=1 Tax=uncultured Marinobacter sp. TaxID=187379 RepID=UPI0026254B32|nr:RodZ domain-containing protein [uncultured Marinobacter sp.]